MVITILKNVMFKTELVKFVGNMNGEKCKMGKSTKIVHLQMLGGTQQELIMLATELKKLKDKTDLDIEFLVSSERVELHSVKYLIDELIKLYRNYKYIKNKQAKKNA